MFKNQMQRVAIFAAAAAGANENVYEDTTLKQAVISSNKALNPLIPYLPPIIQNAKNTVTSQASAAEVRRVQCLNIDDETLIASTRYSVILEQAENKFESTYSQLGIYSYTTPTTTLGSVALDRANLVSILVDKINAHAANKVTAYGIQKVAFNTGAGGTPDFGETTLESTTGTTAIVVKLELTSGAMTGAGVGFLYLYSATAAAVLGETITCSGGTTVVVTATGVENQDILIIDDGSYL